MKMGKDIKITPKGKKMSVLDITVLLYHCKICQIKIVSYSFSPWLLEFWRKCGSFLVLLTQHGMSSLPLLTKLLHLFQGPFQKLFSMELSPQYKSELITSSYGLSKHFEPLNGNYFILPCTIYMFKYVCLIRF